MHTKAIAILVALLLVFTLGMGKAEEVKVDADQIMHKLDEILTNQAEVFKQFEEIKEELAIIKVRASM